MNRFLIPLTILLGSLIYSWFWNCYRRPHCATDEVSTVEQTMVSADTSAAITVDTTQSLTEVEKTLFEPLDVYFQSGQSGINRDEKVNSWLELAKKYLAENPSAKLSVTGHTDSDGSSESNVVLSNKRATRVKGILVAEGFGDDNLVTDGKGEAEPVASNETEEGKAQNRRVSIRLMN